MLKRSKSAYYNEMLGIPMPSFLAQIISDRLKRQGTNVDPRIVDIILDQRDQMLAEEERYPRHKTEIWSKEQNRKIEI